MDSLKKIARSLGTHCGSFHADEVTACALLLLFNLIDRKNIMRTRNLQELEKCEFVCDVGGIYDEKAKRFDHHQAEYMGPLSSAGMVLLFLKNQDIIDEKLYQYFNRSLIIGVDAIDNGKTAPVTGHCSFSAVIANFVPAHHDVLSEEMDSAFFEALDFCLGHLQRLQAKYEYIQGCRDKIKKEMDKRQKVMIFEESMPWLDTFFELGGEEHPAEFIIMPTGTHWKLRGIPPTYEKRMQVRVQLPEEWAGLIDQELKDKTGIPGAIFCHKGRFISVWETKEEALKAYDFIQKRQKE